MRRSIRTLCRGLGVPDSLLGGAEATTRNAQSAFVQLKTLVQRLEYVRSKALEWINAELRLSADAMGFRDLPTVIFGTMSFLRNEAAEAAAHPIARSRGHQRRDRPSHLRCGLHDRAGDPARGAADSQPWEAADRARGLYMTGPTSAPQANTRKGRDRSHRRAGPRSLPRPAIPAGTTPTAISPGTTLLRLAQADRPRSPDTKPRDQRTPKSLSTVYETVADGLMVQIDEIVNPMFLDSKRIKSLFYADAEQYAELEQIKWTCLCCCARTRPRRGRSSKRLSLLWTRVGWLISTSCGTRWSRASERYCNANPPLRSVAG